MDLADIEPFITDRHKGVLVTRRRDGRPQLSNVVYSFADGAFRVSVTNARAKTRNLRRDPAATMHVTSDDFWRYVVADGTAELSAVATEPGDATCALLREIYVDVQGTEHPDWDEFDAAMVAEARLVLSVRPQHVYGQLPA